MNIKKNICNGQMISTNIPAILDHLINSKDELYNQFMLDNNISHEEIKKRLVIFFEKKNNIISVPITSAELLNILSQIFGANELCKKFIYTFSVQHGIGGDESIYFLNDFLEMHSYAIKNIFSCGKLYDNHSKNTNKNKILPGNDYYIEIDMKDIDFNLLISIVMLMQEGPTIRVQRQPINSTQMHTSTIILNTHFINLNKTKQEIKSSLLQEKFFIWETFRASGAGGQHVNKTSSAVRLKHQVLQSVNIISQQERNQIQNKKIALRKLESEIDTYIMHLINSVLNSKQCNTSRNHKSTTYNYRRNQVTHEDGSQIPFNVIKDSYRIIAFKRALGIK